MTNPASLKDATDFTVPDQMVEPRRCPLPHVGEQGQPKRWFDLKTKKVFLPAAEYQETPASDPTKTPQRTLKPGSFTVLVSNRAEMLS